MPKVVNLAEWKARRAQQGFESPTITDICARLEAALDAHVEEINGRLFYTTKEPDQGA